MKRTISMSVGKGSVNHNTRAFHAENTDPERTPLNRCYINQPIQSVYHTLFDEALERFNAKQKRQDRQIPDYYKKIRTGKQEKSFHELIVQVGSLEDCSAITPEGEVAAKILDHYMSKFQERNPYLQVFSAHLHMDEATPHLHIDFVPFTTGSKRGLDTRVSLKGALTAQGFTGGSRGATEWNQWVQSEKAQLAEVMLEHGIEWEQKGTHNQHLAVMDYKKQERQRELKELTSEVKRQQKTLDAIGKKQVAVEKISSIEVKPAVLDKSKVVVDKKEFEGVMTLGQKYLVSERREGALREENSALQAEVQTLQQENTTLRSVRDQLSVTQLKQDYERLKKKLDRAMDFIDRLGLREKLNQFLYPNRKRDAHDER
ncbi:plasmid recombination protein [Bengtsoniella intestinalis]|uniref:plasmid recombination protein n=1 Tax=Bengtsoniella intestinalis TaxID=3073143 RepID=UPI00391F367F